MANVQLHEKRIAYDYNTAAEATPGRWLVTK